MIKKLKREMADPETISEQEDVMAAARVEVSDDFWKMHYLCYKSKKYNESIFRKSNSCTYMDTGGPW